MQNSALDDFLIDQITISRLGKCLAYCFLMSFNIVLVLCLAMSGNFITLCSELKAPFLLNSAVEPKLNFNFCDQLKDSITKMRTSYNSKIADDYRDRVLMISNNSEGFIKGQLELINEFGFRWVFPVLTIVALLETYVPCNFCQKVCSFSESFNFFSAI